MNISEKILKLRKEKGLSQETFAEKLGVSRQSVSKWESGGSLPDIDKIIAMSKFFGVSTDYLLKDETAEEPAETSEQIPDEEPSDVELSENIYDENPPDKTVENAPTKEKKNFKKIFKRIVCILLIILIASSAILLPAYSDRIKDWWYNLNGGKIEHPYVFVHGLGGWGDGSGINNVATYWGGGNFDLKQELEEKGHVVHTPSIGPVSSTWDRTCELYAQLTGTTVDYGEAHSKEHNHERYGKTYVTPLVENWGEKVNGGQTVKINLVGHSFGGATVRLLASLLEYGDEAEIKASGDNVSPLFEGDKGDYVHSVTTLCAPHNGSTLTEVLNTVSGTIGISDTTDLLMSLCFGLSGINLPVDGVYDLGLGHFGVDKSDAKNAISALTAAGNDHAAYDLSPDGAAQLNKKIRTVPGVYYFSYAYSTTKESKLLGAHMPKSDTFAVLYPFAIAMGSYTGTTKGGINIDTSWKENDGLVNVVSARYPFGESHTDLPKDKENIETGIWYVDATREGDHGAVIGLNSTKTSTVKFYKELFGMINNL